MQIEKHPIWNNIHPFKKPFHLGRIYLAKRNARLYSPKIYVGITGSLGKTTTSKCCYAVLSQKYRTLSTSLVSSNLDPVLNIPITLLKVRPSTEKVILEMGVEYPGEMDFYLSLVKPSVAIVTRIYFAHSEFLGGVEEIQNEKSELVRALPKEGCAILNYDDLAVRRMAEETEAEVFFYGLDPKKCEVWASNVRIENFQTVFELNHGVERVEVRLNLLGKHQVYPALAAATLGVINKLSLITIKNGLESVEAAEHRLQLLSGIRDFLILDDSYNNASPVGVEAALELLYDLKGKKRVLVLGEMRELGKFSEKLHRELARYIYQQKLDYILLGTGDTTYVAEELLSLGYPPDKIESNLSNTHLVSKILRLVGKGDIVLIKASRSHRFDEVVKRLTKTSSK